MRPLYDGQENQYKKMLDLQERLRRSEEERIRLEEKFGLLVQESRNRHESCINQLRIRYVEFLEEQRARDERNNKLLGTLDKVDSSLALMTAKTERLNILRKQYEAYLLRAYGTLRSNESVAADSGLESQNDRDTSRTPVFSKSVALARKSSIEFPAPSPRKAPSLELPDAYKLSAIRKSADIQRNLKDKFAQAAAVPSFYDEAKDAPMRTRLYSPSLSTDAPKHKPEIGTRSSYGLDPVPPHCAGTPSVESATKLVNALRNPSARSATSTPVANSKYELDRYLSRIEQAQEEALEPERSLEDAEQEQNTSGDLLNVTLSDDGNRSSPEEVATPARDSRSRFRALLMRQAYAAENGSGNRPSDRTRHSPIAKPRGGCEAEEALTIDKFRQSEIATPLRREVGKPFARPAPLSVDEAFAKLALLSEPRRPNNPNSPPVVEKVEAAKEREARLLAETAEDDEDDEDDEDQESRYGGDREDGDRNADGIEDDYDDTVDIDSWVPDDAEQQLEEAPPQDGVRDMPRRMLESIEEVEQLDDEPDEEMAISDAVTPAVDESPMNERADEIPSTENANDAPPESNEEPSEQVSETHDANEQYANQQYYPQDVGEQQQYQENAETYEQQQGDEQQHYQYSEDPNQQYGYDVNAPYTGYDSQQYTEAQYEEYMKQYQQYDPNQAYEHDPNQQYHQHYDYSQDPQAYGEGYSQEVNQAYDYSAEAYAAQQSSELYRPDGKDQPQELTGEQSGQGSAADETSAVVNQSAAYAAAPPVKDKPKEAKKTKKDVIKSILDSDSESFIERNLSNTESDFDFN